MNLRDCQNGKYVCPVAEHTVMEFICWLHLRNLEQLKKVVEDMYNPLHPTYKQYMTTEQFHAAYSPDKHMIQHTTYHLRKLGFEISEICPNNQFIRLKGTVATIQTAFQLHLNHYETDNGDTFIGHTEYDASIPPTLQSYIVCVLGLNTNPIARRIGSTPSNSFQAMIGTGPGGGYTPNEIRYAYNFLPILFAGFDGLGQNVAIFALDNYSDLNVNTYINYYGLPSSFIGRVYLNQFVPIGPQQIETELDIQITKAIAPRANQLVYLASNSLQNFLLLFQRIANDNFCKIISCSWGIQELVLTSNYLLAGNQIFIQLTAQGQSLYSASGDFGAFFSPALRQLAVTFPSSSPYNTSVGGTSMFTNGVSTRFEVAWNLSGGGRSVFFLRPAWQIGVGTNNVFTNGFRMVPDVASVADPFTGFSIYSRTGWTQVGGTSAGPPLWAGLTAISNQFGLSKGRNILGFPSPRLYALLVNLFAYSQSFVDIVTGSNGFYPATPGYDMVTGIGAPNATNLINWLNNA